MESKKATYGTQVLIKQLSANKIARVEYGFEFPGTFQELKNRFAQKSDEYNLAFDEAQKQAEEKGAGFDEGSVQFNFGTYQVVPTITGIEFWNRFAVMGNTVKSTTALNLEETRIFVKMLNEIESLPAEERDLGEIYS